MLVNERKTFLGTDTKQRFPVSVLFSLINFNNTDVLYNKINWLPVNFTIRLYTCRLLQNVTWFVKMVNSLYFQKITLLVVMHLMYSFHFR